MTRVFTISKVILKNWVRSPSGVFFSVLFPIILFVVFSAVFGGQGSSSYSLYVQNFDVYPNGTATTMSSTFLTALNSSKIITISEIIPNNVADPIKYTQDKLGFFGGSPRIMIIPQGFSNALINSSIRTRITVINSTINMFMAQFGSYLNNSQIQSMSQGMEIMSSSLSMLSKDNATLIMVTDPSQTSSSIAKSIIMNFAQSFSNYMIGAKPFMEFEDRAFISKSLKAGDYYLPGYIAAFIMSNGLMGVAQDTAEFKRRGVLKRLATTPLRKLEWVTGNVIAQAILGFLLSGVMILTGYVLYGITVIPNILSIALILAGSMAFSGLALIISGTLEDVEAVASLGSAISFPMMFLSGSFVPLEIMPKYLQTVSQFLPLTYLSNGLRAALITGDESNAIFNLIVILIVGIIAIILGAWLTRWKEK